MRLHISFVKAVRYVPILKDFGYSQRWLIGQHGQIVNVTKLIKLGIYQSMRLNDINYVMSFTSLFCHPVSIFGNKGEREPWNIQFIFKCQVKRLHYIKNEQKIKN